jgi:glutaconate CoA-transferase subunit B
MTWTVAELMAILFARNLRPGDIVVTGTSAHIPLSACRVAGLLGKPGISAMIGATGTLDPGCMEIPASGGDQDFVPGRMTLGLRQGVADQLRGAADVIFLGGLQVDREGRCNLCVVGDYDRPRLRGPGSIGLSMVASVRRTFMFFLKHERRIFVEQVDFVSGDGLRPEGGLELIVTPLAVFAPNAGRTEIALKSIHPGVFFDDIQARTGFTLERDRAPVTEPPSAEELSALRSFPSGRDLGSLRF